VKKKNCTAPTRWRLCISTTLSALATNAERVVDMLWTIPVQFTPFYFKDTSKVSREGMFVYS
jgi:hypothetical protein